MAKRTIYVSIARVSGSRPIFVSISVHKDGRGLGASWFCDSPDEAWNTMARAFDLRVMDANMAGDTFEVKAW